MKKNQKIFLVTELLCAIVLLTCCVLSAMRGYSALAIASGIGLAVVTFLAGWYIAAYLMTPEAIKDWSKLARIMSKVATYTFLTVMALIILFPFYWMIISSVKSLDEYHWTIPSMFPHTFDFANYSEVFDLKVSVQNVESTLLDFFINTVIVGVSSTLISVVITVISAFAFARLEFKGKNAMFAALLGTMMIPGELFTITNYITISTVGKPNFLGGFFAWMSNDTFGALVVPFLVSVFYIYLLRQNFMQIPNELYLAAKVDGTKDIKYLWKVMIPLSLPTLISITILKMMGAWNTYAWPNLVAPKIPLITNGIRLLASTVDQGMKPDYPLQMAAVVLVSAPLFLVFIFLRKYIMKGVSRSGIKG